LRTSQRSRRGGRPPKAEPAVATAPSALDKVRSEIFIEGKTRPCKYRGTIKSCFGEFTLTWRTAARQTFDNVACIKRLRKDTHDPAVRRYNADPVNRATVINPRRRRNYPAAKGRINQLRRDATFDNRQLKPCEITTISDADLPTDHHRATFAKARKTCLGEFYPKGKTQTCSDPCSEALEKLSHYWRQKKSNTKNKAKANATRSKRRAQNKAKGLPPDTPKGFREIEPRDIKCEYCGGMFKYYKPGQAPLACPKPKCRVEYKEHDKQLRREAEHRRQAKKKKEKQTARG
jgi:hypothetical protein